MTRVQPAWPPEPRVDRRGTRIRKSGPRLPVGGSCLAGGRGVSGARRAFRQPGVIVTDWAPVGIRPLRSSKRILVGPSGERLSDHRAVVEHNIGSDRAVAYYAWCMAQIQVAAAPGRVRKGAGRYPQPVALLARLGVDIDHEGEGLGTGLLQDVFARLVELADDIGCRGLLVHAESEPAPDFYLHLVAEFEPSPTDDLHLVLLMKDIRRALRR